MAITPKIVLGTPGNDTLQGDNGSDLFGYGGDDVYEVQADYYDKYGFNPLPTENGTIVHEEAGGGNDTINVELHAQHHPYVDTFNPEYYFGTLNYTLGDNVENLNAVLDGSTDWQYQLHGNELANVIAVKSGGTGKAAIHAGAGNDTLNGGVSNDTLDGGTGNDVMKGKAGNDIYYVDSAGDSVVENSAEGNDDQVYSSVSFTLGANIEALSLTGSNNINGDGNALGNDLLGNTGNNLLSGLDGDDHIEGYDGNDTLDGGAGQDEMYGGGGKDILKGGADGDYLDGGSDNDMLDGGAGHDNMYGGSGGDSLLGGDGDDSLWGNDGNDDLKGGAGNDMLSGGSGSDTMEGGAGNDRFYVDAGDTVTDSGGDDSVYAQEQLNGDLATNIERLYLQGSIVTGRGNAGGNYIQGNSVGNVLHGLAGNDTMDGGYGADTFYGGAGNDIFAVDNSGDKIVENVGEGTDHVFTSVSFSLSANIENLTLGESAGNSNGIGNASDNVLLGNSHDNLLDGGAGNDMLTGKVGEDNLIGGAGNDTLDGGMGVDFMFGGLGNDIYIVDQFDDVVGGELAGGGYDEVRSTAYDFTLGINLEKLVLTGEYGASGFGNAAANTIIGNAGDNLIDGRAGNDTMEGGAGNDTYYVDALGDVIKENANAGSDTVIVNLGSFDLNAKGANVENLVFDTRQTSPINAKGNALANTITTAGGADSLDGGVGNDMLSGMAGNDTLKGGDGNDTLNGGTGADSMDGGVGNDSYIVDHSSDSIADSGGVDSVTSYVSYTLAAALENLSLAGSGNIDGAGNALANAITGNGGNNALAGNGGNDTLDGGMGADSMQGGTGNDTYYVDNGADNITEDVAGGTDTVFSSISIALKAYPGQVMALNVENATLTGGDNLSVWGNTGNNILIGNSGSNYIYSEDGGVDLLKGGAGNDYYYIGFNAAGASGDTIEENADGGNDWVYLYLESGATPAVGVKLTYTLSTNVDHARTYSESVGAKITGNALDNAIYGADGGDILLGMAGNDQLYGGNGDNSLDGGDDNDGLYTNNGNDTLKGGNGNDYLGAGNGSNNLDGGAGNDSMYGGDNNDTMTGGAGNDYLSAHNGNNSLDGGDGNDEMYADNGNDTLVGGSGDDHIGAGNGQDSLDGGAGNDTLYADDESGGDTLKGGAGDDFYYIDQGDVINGEAAGGGTDMIYVYSGSEAATLDMNSAALGGGQVENLVVYDFNTFQVSVTGTAAANRLYNITGCKPERPTSNATLDGGAGDDYFSDYYDWPGYDIYSGVNDTVFVGGAGDDVFDIRSLSGGDRFFGGSGGGTPVDSGNDTLNIDFAWNGQVNLDSKHVETINIKVNETSDTAFNSYLVINDSSGVNQVNVSYVHRGLGNGAGIDLWFAKSSQDVAVSGFRGGYLGLGDDSANHIVNLSISDSSMDLIDANNSPDNSFDRVNITLSGENEIDVSNLTSTIHATGEGATGLSGLEAMALESFSGMLRLGGGGGVTTLQLDDVAAVIADTSNMTLLALDTTGTHGASELDVGGSNDDITVTGNQNLTLFNVGDGGYQVVNASGFGANLLVTMGGNGGEVKGGTGDDTLSGSGNSDVLRGGLGADALRGGGSGPDFFVFDNLGAADRILDFQSGTDNLVLLPSTFTALDFSGTVLNESDLFSGTLDQYMAASSTANLVFDNSLGNLYYDSDGAAGGAVATLVAHLDMAGGPGLAHTDIINSLV